MECGGSSTQRGFRCTMGNWRRRNGRVRIRGNRCWKVWTGTRRDCRNLLITDRVCFEVNRIKPNNIDLATDPCTILLSYSKSPSFTRRKPDGLDGRPAQTLPAKVPIKHKGLTCVENASDGGAFKYLMVSIAEGQAEAETQPANIGSSESQSLSENMLRPYRLLIQKLLAWGQHTAYGPNLPAVEISAMFVDCTDFSATLHEQGNTEASDASSLSSSTTVDVDKTKPRISSRQTGLEDDKSAKDNAMIADLKHWFAAQESRYVIKLQKHAKNLMMVLDVKTASIREWMSALRSSTEYAIADFKASEAQMNKQIRAGLDANRASAKRRRVEADAQNIKGTPDL